MFNLNDDAGSDIIDVRDIIARAEALKELAPETPEDVMPGTGEEREANAAELATLEAVLAGIAGKGGDEQWRGVWYPITLIRDSYFTDYARELVEDCGYIAKDFPTWIEVDWNATARNVRMDYTSTEIEGVTYWYC